MSEKPTKAELKKYSGWVPKKPEPAPAAEPPKRGPGRPRKEEAVESPAPEGNDN